MPKKILYKIYIGRTSILKHWTGIYQPRQGCVCHLVNGQIHNEHGPARFIYCDGEVKEQYWLKDFLYTKAEWEKILFNDKDSL